MIAVISWLMNRLVVLIIFSLFYQLNAVAFSTCLELFSSIRDVTSVFGLDQKEMTFLERAKAFTQAPFGSTERQKIQWAELKIIFDDAAKPVQRLIDKAPLEAQEALHAFYERRRLNLLEEDHKHHGVTQKFAIKWSLQLARLLSLVELVDASYGQGQVPYTKVLGGAELISELVRN